MNKPILVAATVLGFIAVGLGAFAAHGLKNLISPESISTFETGVRYQIYYAILLLFVGGTSYIRKKSKTLIFYLSLFGVILFSGSIYGLATNELTLFDFKNIALATPIGGFLLISVWVVLFLNFIKSKTA